MAYLGGDLSNSYLLRRDANDGPQDDMKWNLGSENYKWLGIYADTFYGNMNGNASTSTSWSSSITVTVGGDVSGSFSFDGSQDITTNLVVNDDSHNHTKTTITNFDDEVQDVVAAMVQDNIELGILVGYDAINSKLNFQTNSPTITLSGDATGSATMTNLSDITIDVNVANDSHTHDTQYYTQTQSDAKYALISGSTMTGDINMDGQKILNLPNPSSYYEPITLTFGDSRYINASGTETLTGSLTVTGTVTQNTAPTSDNHLATKAYVDNNLPQPVVFNVMSINGVEYITNSTSSYTLNPSTIINSVNIGSYDTNTGILILPEGYYKFYVLVKIDSANSYNSKLYIYKNDVSLTPLAHRGFADLNSNYNCYEIDLINSSDGNDEFKFNVENDGGDIIEVRNTSIMVFRL